MKYYLIAGEASGDLHASRLMHAISKRDRDALYRYIGGDLMAAEGGSCLCHYKTVAYMGFVPVLLHLRTIATTMALCKRDIVAWRPDVVILVDYPGFNLTIAKYAHSKGIKVFYYISPKIWAWKEWRIKTIKRAVDEMFSILPFEVAFYEKRHDYTVHYVGNPTAAEVVEFKKGYTTDFVSFCNANNLDAHKQIIALLPGSRHQEIKDNLPNMLKVAARHPEYQAVIAGALPIDADFYVRFGGRLLVNKTYELLSHATAALVTSGTATLETALFNVPQIVCYKTPLPHVIRFAFKHLIKVKFISLVNLIVGHEIVPEMFADRFTVNGIDDKLVSILPGGDGRQAMLDGYGAVSRAIGSGGASDTAARLMTAILCH